jgi:CheY-like chemotaxis protein
MPRVDGITLIAYLRSISPDTPVLIVTGYPDRLLGIATFPRIEVINKPVLLEDLQSKIGLLLEH